MLDPQPWMAQVGIAGALTILLISLGKSYINHVSSQLKDLRQAHAEELERLTKSWEARLADCSKRGDSWETAANRWQAAALEDREQANKALLVGETTVSLLSAIREEQLRR